MSAVSVLWTLLSIFLLGCCGVAVFSPFWFEHIPDPLLTSERTENYTFVAFGLLRYCSKEPFESLNAVDQWRNSDDCSFYGYMSTDILSLFWKVSAILYLAAMLMLFMAILLAHVSCCRKVICGRSIFAVAALMQLVAVVSLGCSLVLYPFGLSSEFAMKHCAGSDVFNPGTCDVAWGYVLAMVTAGLLVFCPLLAHHLMRVTPRSKATVV